MMLWCRCCIAARGGVAARLDTRRPVSYGHPRCHERATCVLDPGPHERPDGSWDSSSAPGFGLSSQENRSSRADRIREAKKSLCSVTTRRRNRWSLSNFRCDLRSLPARALGLGMPGLHARILTMSGLSPCRLPTVDLSPAFRILAVALVPGPRHVLASAPFAQADPRPRPARSSGTMGRCLTVTGAHGRLVSQGKARGECASVLPERYPRRERNAYLSVYGLRRNKTKKKTGFASRTSGTRHQGR
jgi:hypothetical protein